VTAIPDHAKSAASPLIFFTIFTQVPVQVRQRKKRYQEIMKDSSGIIEPNKDTELLRKALFGFALLMLVLILVTFFLNLFQ